MGPMRNPYGVVFDSATGGMTFLSDGSVPGGITNTEIVVTEDVPANAAAKTVSVNRMTGFIRVLSR